MRMLFRIALVAIGGIWCLQHSARHAFEGHHYFAGLAWVFVALLLFGWASKLAPTKAVAS